MEVRDADTLIFRGMHVLSLVFQPPFGSGEGQDALPMQRYMAENGSLFEFRAILRLFAAFPYISACYDFGGL